MGKLREMLRFKLSVTASQESGRGGAYWVVADWLLSMQRLCVLATCSIPLADHQLILLPRHKWRSASFDKNKMCRVKLWRICSMGFPGSWNCLMLDEKC